MVLTLVAGNCPVASNCHSTKPFEERIITDMRSFQNPTDNTDNKGKLFVMVFADRSCS
jgi:hypothetical protein